MDSLPLDKAPEFPTSLEWINVARPPVLKEMLGRVVLLEFWTHCCINSQHNVAQLRQLQNHFPDELIVIGIHSPKFTAERSTASVRQAVLRLGIEHPVVNDERAAIRDLYSVRAWPTQVLIDPQGHLSSVSSGEFLAEDFTPIIESLCAKKSGQVKLSPLSFLLEKRIEPERVLYFPSRLLITADGHLYIADSGHHRILEVRLQSDGLSGEIIRIFGSGLEGFQDGNFQEASFNSPHGMAIRGTMDEKVLYVADTGNHVIRAINLKNGLVRTVAGTGKIAHAEIRLGKPLETPLRSPWALHSMDQFLFIAMAGSHQIWVLVNEEQIGSFAGNGLEALVDGPAITSSFNQPSDITFSMGALLVADPEASALRSVSLDSHPNTSTLLGKGLFSFGDQDGDVNTALLQYPLGLTYANSMIFIVDTYNNKIKVLNPRNGQIQTLIGNGKTGSADGDFLSSELNEPGGVRAYQNLLYIADTNNHLVRVADLQSRVLSTLGLHGLERLPPIVPKNKWLTSNLETLTAAPGRVKVILKIRLPGGFKFHPGTHLNLKLIQDGNERIMALSPKKSLVFEVDLIKGCNLMVDLTFYYCQTSDIRTILVHNRRLIIPFQVSETADSIVQVHYSLVQA